MVNILVIGGRVSDSHEPGRLAQSLIDYIKGNTDISIEHATNPANADLIVYCRRTEDLLSDTIAYCNKTGTALAFLSSGIEVDLPKDIDFPFIEMRNASVDVIKYMQRVAKVAKDHPDWQMKIIEHHQPSKKDISGTALKMADMTGHDPSVIDSVRDIAQTRQDFDVPGSASEGYAIHRAAFYDSTGAEVCEPIDMVVVGRDTYAQGVISLFESLKNLPQGQQDIIDLVNSQVVAAD